MSVREKRQEILRLIARLQPGEAAAVAAKAKAPAKQASPAHRRLRALSQLKEQRQALESDLLETRMLRLYQQLEQRVAALERGGGAGTGAGAAPPDSSGPASGRSSSAAGSQSDAVAPWTFSGRVQEGILADMLQLVSSNMMSGIFTIEDQSTKAEVIFIEGEIKHARAGSTTGEDAFFVAMSLEQGRYYFLETEDLPEETTITSKAQLLILEGLRRIDESRANT